MSIYKLTAAIFSFGAYFFIVSCNTSPTRNSALDTKKSASDSTFNICYSSVAKKDTVLLNAHMSGDSITGSLGYKLYEKDQNNGSILGKMYGDTLRAMYTFMSEGKSSVRQVAFLKQNDDFVELYGNSKMEDGKMVFENRSTLKFSDAMALQKESCSANN